MRMRMNTEIIFRKANIGDLVHVVKIYKNAINRMEKNNILQWDDLYPNEVILKDDILKEQMFLGEINNKIVSVVVLNKNYDEEYKNGNWNYKDLPFAVVHRLCVNPDFQNKGIGNNTMLSIEKLLKKDGIETIRLDAFSLNPYALSMYEKLGYKKVGEVNWIKGLFYLYEKKI
jgi:GNAT superfamily N-acetyltransferase